MQEDQLFRYKRLINLVEEKFKENLSIEEIEEVTFYSYRNINRIFLALQNETIGKYIKRLRLEKAAEYLKYDEADISDIALEIGYSDIAAFSKAFKNHFDCSPSVFRETAKSHQKIIQQTLEPEKSFNRLEFKVEILEDFEMLYLEYKGSYENIEAIKQTAEQLIKYVSKKGLVKKDSIFLGQILDDNDITDTIHCRYRFGLVLEKPLNFTPKDFFAVQTIPAQKYAKFIHKGSHKSSENTYTKIYANWFNEVQLEFEAKAILEIYLNDEQGTPDEELITEIYIPVK